MTKDELDKYLAHLPARNTRRGGTPPSTSPPPSTATQNDMNKHSTRSSFGVRGPRGPSKTATVPPRQIYTSGDSTNVNRNNRNTDTAKLGSTVTTLMNDMDLNKSSSNSSFSAATPSPRKKADDSYGSSDISTGTSTTMDNSTAATTGKHELENSNRNDTYATSTDPSLNAKHMDETYKTPVSSTQQPQPKTDAMPPIPTFSFGNVNTSNEDTMPPIPTFSFGNGDDDDNHNQQDHSNDDILNLSLGLRCGGCDKLISGMAITAAGHRWHADCFKCQHCHQDLEHVAFYEKDGLPYCALDYHELFTTRCQYCHTPIEEKSIHALGKYYHVGHFFCRECGKPFDEDSTFMEHDGHPYCEKDYLAKFAHKCKGCKEDITGDFLEALDGKWHMTCFVCVDCGRAFESNTFYVRNNLPYCEQHSRRIKKPT